MIVYRIEHRTERHGASGHYHGPFGGSLAASDYFNVTGRDPYAMPTPNMEGLEMRDEYVCGFHDWVELKHWFGNQAGRCAMSKHGFCIREYYTDDYEQGSIQTVFACDTAVTLQMIDLDTLEPIE